MVFDIDIDIDAKFNEAFQIVMFAYVVLADTFYIALFIATCAPALGVPLVFLHPDLFHKYEEAGMFGIFEILFHCFLLALRITAFFPKVKPANQVAYPYPSTLYPEINVVLWIINGFFFAVFGLDILVRQIWPREPYSLAHEFVLLEMGVMGFIICKLAIYFITQFVVEKVIELIASRFH